MKRKNKLNLPHNIQSTRCRKYITPISHREALAFHRFELDNLLKDIYILVCFLLTNSGNFCVGGANDRPVFIYQAE